MAPLAHLLKGFDVNSYIDFGSGKGDTTNLEDRRSVPVTTKIQYWVQILIIILIM